LWAEYLDDAYGPKPSKLEWHLSVNRDLPGFSERHSTTKHSDNPNFKGVRTQAMVETNPASGAIRVTVLPQENGQYRCELASTFDDPPQTHVCWGQTREHAIAIALEQLADQYRQKAEEQQNLDWDDVERTEAGVVITKRYHVVLHYERIAEEESKFEAMHNTIMGNTVVENAKITVIEVEPSLPIEPLARSWL
jgi:phosphoribosylformylglycinamidine (FGAM) synthase PurS component